MKTLLWLASAALGLAVLVWVYDNYAGYVWDRYDRHRYPAIKGKSPLSAGIEKEIGTREYRAALKEYRGVEARLEAAAAEGFDVTALRGKLAHAGRLIQQGNFRYAKIHLNAIALRTPKRRSAEHVAVVNDADFEGAELPTPDGRSQGPAPKTPSKGAPRRRTR